MRRSSSPELATAGIPPGGFNPLADTSLSALVAGFVAMMTGYTSSLVLMFQAGQAAHLTNAQISSWIWALSIGMALCTIGLSLRFRAPIVIAWSTPGAALPHAPYAEAIGAFVVCALLLTVVGLTGWFDTLMKKIPACIAAALLAGILFEIGIEIFRAAQFQTALVLTMFLTYLVGKRIAPRYAIPLTLIAGVFGATIAALFAAFPRELVVSVAALALFGSIMSGLTNAMQDARQREAALVTFMVTASGLTLLSIGSAFWGLVAGVVTQVVLNARRA
ncbi:MAG: Benzoate transport protein [uncultured Paraburkholderia sp.]|nr:MAG: Benzoate transport protein [uncultured Paraburkholderia sp.]CAH2914616.1 MAG: Benzoate transport protein [uncultured Paraburkholderia sp.]